MICLHKTFHPWRTWTANLHSLNKMNKVRSRWDEYSEGICVKYIIQHFFLPNWEDKKIWAQRENFPPHFLSLLNQTVKNAIFYSIFLSLFLIIPVFTLTKHIIKFNLEVQTRNLIHDLLTKNISCMEQLYKKLSEK